MIEKNDFSFWALLSFEVVGLRGELVGLWGCGVVGLYGCAFERDPYEGSVLIELWLRKISFLAGINHTTYATAPVFQERSLKQYVSNSRVLRVWMMRLFDGLNSQFVWQMASILNLYTIIIDSDAESFFNPTN